MQIKETESADGQRHDSNRIELDQGSRKGRKKRFVMKMNGKGTLQKGEEMKEKVIWQSLVK